MIKEVIDIEDVIKTTNVSTLFILPLFSKITEDVNYKRTSTSFNFIPLLYEYGLVKTYCYSYLSTENNCLFLVFDKKEVTKQMENTSKNNQTLNNLIIASQYFVDVDKVNDFLIYSLRIPEEFLKDVSFIKRGQYSKISKEYVEKLLTNSVLNRKNLKSQISYKITQQNIAYAVCLKKQRIKLELERTIGSTIPEDIEYYQKFSTLKETLISLDLIKME